MTVLFTTIVVAAALWPIYREWTAPSPSDAPRPGRRARVTTLWIGCSIAIATIASWSVDGGLVGAGPAGVRSGHSTVETNRPVATATSFGDSDQEYVSSRACRACHPREHATWHESFHRTMTRVGAEARAAAPVVRPGQDLAHGGRSYRVETRGQDLWVGPPDQLRKVVQITGSHHFQAFWVPSGESRNLTLFPFCFQLGIDRWLPIDTVFVMPPGTRQATDGGRWNKNCQMCHATGVRPGLGLDGSMDTTVAEFGIACEACHGPGGEHVRANRDPLRRYQRHLWGDEAGDPTITNPARLDPYRSAETCGQCHALTLVRSEHASHWRQHGFRYRPGDDLSATRVVITADTRDPEFDRIRRQDPGFVESKFWSDGVIRVTGREYNGLIKSPCFADADDASETMTCLSCHALHAQPEDERPLSDWAVDQLGQGMHSNSACTQCHDGYADAAALAAHTHHATDSTGSQCYNCHMSHTTYGLQKVVRSHVVESPSVQTSLATGRPNACNQCHLDRTLDWTAGLLEARYGIERPKLDEDQRTVAASVLWTLRGDAGQRVLMAWSYGWQPARAASGTEWMLPYITELMRDPYDAVRAIAGRSLANLPSGETYAARFDFLAPKQQRTLLLDEIRSDWNTRTRSANPATLIRADGRITPDTYARLLAARNHRRVFLTE